MRSPALRAHPLVFGVVVFLASESMLFAGLLAAWFDLRGENAAWPPRGIALDPMGADIGTALLVLGSILVVVAQTSAARKRYLITRIALICTLMCALSFVYFALRDWSQSGIRVDTNAYSTLFFVLTGTHLAHVLVGALLLGAVSIYLRRPAFQYDHQAGIEGVAYYWHFLLVMWLAIWASIYLLR